MPRWVFSYVRFSGAALLAAGLLIGWTGCGGSQDRTQRPQLRTTVAELESTARQSRYRMRDLENRIHVLQDRLRDAETPRPAAPRLPVEVRGPAPDPEPAEDHEYEVVGVDDDGFEIVYVGDAAQDHSVNIPAPQPSAPPRRAGVGLQPLERDARRSSGSSSVSHRVPETLPEALTDPVEDRLPVTDRVGPTVERRVRGAPASPPLQARPAPRSRPVREVPSPSPPRQSPARASDVASSREPTKRDPRGLYKESYGALRAGDHAAAIAGFRSFLDAYPRHDFADNSVYWLGEAFYDQRDYRAALDEFRRVVTDYPDGNKVPDAMLKMGYCYLALGDASRARATLFGVIELHPTSSSAGLAARKLETLDSK